MDEKEVDYLFGGLAMELGYYMHILEEIHTVICTMVSLIDPASPARTCRTIYWALVLNIAWPTLTNTIASDANKKTGFLPTEIATGMKKMHPTASPAKLTA